jgi:hypothetical protein
MKNVGAVTKVATITEFAGKTDKTPQVNFDGAG